MDKESLAHTKWNCKYHMVFAPKYRGRSGLVGCHDYCVAGRTCPVAQLNRRMPDGTCCGVREGGSPLLPNSFMAGYFTF